MSDDQDLALGKAAIERGFITQQQVEECMKIAETVRLAGLKRSLADVLVEKSFITDMQAEVLRRATASTEVKVIGGFELIEKIGEGGMGVVYKARQISMDRTVALKLLPERLAKDEKYTARFMREARMAAKLDHVNIVRGIDAGQDGDEYYFAMEFVEGESLQKMLEREGALAEERALHIAIQAARALEHAWESKLIHRDIKPDNILITEKGVAKVADMGLAKETTGDSTSITQTGTAMGTPLYMSPEQARGEKRVDIRTDIYSLGATLYHMVAGETPFGGSTAAVIITKHLTQNPPPAHVRRPGVSENVSRVIAKMMAKKVEGRYDDPGQLLEDLELVADGNEPKHAGQIGGMAPGLAPGATLMSKADLSQFESQIAVAAARKWIVPLAVGGGVLALALVALIVVLITSGGGREDQARRELAAIRGLVKAGKLDSAYDDALKGAALYADTGLVGEFSGLAKEIEDEKKRLAQEAERKRTEAAAAREKARLEALAEEGRSALDGVEALVAAKKFDEARAALEASAEKLRKAGLVKEMDELSRKIDAAEKAERERIAREKQKEEEAARRNQFAERVRLGDRRFAERDFKGALEAYESAAQLESTPELKEKLKGKMDDCRFELAAAEGRAAEERQDLDGAAQSYRRALHIREDAALSARLQGVLDLMRKREFEALVAAARGVDPDEATDEDEIRKALESAKKALELAGEKEKAELEAHTKGLEKALKYLAAIEEARAADLAGEWDNAGKAAAMALEARPRDLEASEILARARVELNRPKEVATGIGMGMVWVPGAEFRMGTDSADPDERPLHTVRAKGFYIGLTEVTNAQYEKFDPRHARARGRYSKGPDDPVVNVSWQHAVAFCRWLSRKDGGRYRLPTEAEWEYAARGKTDRVYPWGHMGPAADGTFRANFGEGDSRASWKRDGFVHAAPVASFPVGASPFGCLDMAGNVWEWCSDWYGPYRVTGGVADNPTGPSSGAERVIRGGSWYHDAASLRVTNRWSKEPNKMSCSTGFRVVMEPE